MPPRQPPSPWSEFLTEVDSLLPETTSLHCLGGFVITVCYGVPRVTGDVDYVSVVPIASITYLQQIAGPESSLTKKYRVYLQYVGIVTLPEDYEKRLIEMFAGCFQRLRIFVLDPYDLALSKLERNSPKDREDVAYLAKKIPLDAQVLRERYQQEQRPYLSRQEWHDGTLEMWIESYFPRGAASA